MNSMLSFCLYRASFVSRALMVDDQDIKFQIWDTAGQERVSELHESGSAEVRSLVPAG